MLGLMSHRKASQRGYLTKPLERENKIKKLKIIPKSHKLTKDTMNTKALVQLDLISRIHCLRDCATNSSNCDQVDGMPMIVDFRIEKQSGGYFKSDILYKFYEGFNYVGMMATAVGIPQEQKSLILRESLQEWKLLTKSRWKCM
jgi:hypothetical protein